MGFLDVTGFFTRLHFTGFSWNLVKPYKIKESHKNSCKMVGVAFENVKRDKCVLLFKHLYFFFYLSQSVQGKLTVARLEHLLHAESLVRLGYENLCRLWGFVPIAISMQVNIADLARFIGNAFKSETRL